MQTWTIDYYGALQPLVPAYCNKDIQSHILVSTGNLYHSLCHSYIHSGKAVPLDALYKRVFYILQNDYYFRTGQFIQTKKELLSCLNGMDKEVLQTAMTQKESAEGQRDALHLLFIWCQNVLHRLSETSQ